MDNIWSYLLSGGIWLIQVLIMPLFGDASAQAGAMNLVKYIGSGSYIVFELIYDTLGSVVNLYLFGAFMTLVLVMFFIRALVAAYLFLLKLIPVVGH